MEKCQHLGGVSRMSKEIEFDALYYVDRILDARDDLKQMEINASYGQARPPVTPDKLAEAKRDFPKISDMSIEHAIGADSVRWAVLYNSLIDSGVKIPVGKSKKLKSIIAKEIEEFEKSPRYSRKSARARKNRADEGNHIRGGDLSRSIDPVSAKAAHGDNEFTKVGGKRRIVTCPGW